MIFVFLSSRIKNTSVFVLIDLAGHTGVVLLCCEISIRKLEVFFMRELRNTKIIAVDHGYGNMKTANTVTPTGIKAYETEPIFTGNILEYNGIYYRIGKGHKEFIPDKAMDEEYYLLTLMAM